MGPWILAVLGTLAYWCLFIGWLDRRMAPAWEVRDNYRFLSALLVFTCLLTLLKAVQYHTELVTLISSCQ